MIPVPASTTTKMMTSPRQQPACTVIQPPFNGVYNLVYRVEFSDGTRWALKIPRRGHAADWTTLAARSLISEARVMQLLKRETTIPVPDVYAFDATLDNALGCPYIAMRWIDAISLDNYWDVNAPFPEKLDMRQRIQLLQDLAAAVVQLNRFRFDHCGIPVFREDGDIKGVGPAMSVDSIADPSLAPPLVEAGPFTKCQDYLNWKVEHFALQSPGAVDEACLESFGLFSSWVQETIQHPESFVLAHRDLGPQNILVDGQGRLCGIIDWEMAAVLPECLSNGRNGSYPHWLSRDFDMFRGHASSSSTGTLGSDLIDIEREFFRFNLGQTAHAEISGSRNGLPSTLDLAEDLPSEELEFYRTVWRSCLEDASSHPGAGLIGSLSLVSVEDILAKIPRTYAAGLTPARSLDGRILLKAAEYPAENLETIVTSIKRHIAHVRESQSQLRSEAMQMRHQDTILCTYGEDGLPAWTACTELDGVLSKPQVINLNSCLVAPLDGDTPPFSFEDGATETSALMHQPLSLLPQSYGSDEFTPPLSPSTTELPFMLDGSTLGTDELSGPSSISKTSSIASDSSEDDTCAREGELAIVTDGEVVNPASAMEVQSPRVTEDQGHMEMEESELKRWFLYLYAGSLPEVGTGMGDEPKGRGHFAQSM